MNLKKLFPFAAFATLVGCATPGQYASQPRVISYEEASVFERSLLASVCPCGDNIEN